MAIVAVHQIPSLTRERYEEVVRRLTNGKGRLESPSDVPLEGLLVHAAAQTETAFLVFDVFESEEAFNRFVEAVRPIAQEVGIEEPPKAYSAHTFISS
jgi:heme-degrading monooxygenase HmoA